MTKQLQFRTLVWALIFAFTPLGAQAQQKPNIVFIMSDDVGWFNVGAYNRGIMAGRTPNLDRLAAEGMLFTDYYAEASCTAGRANFITGELPIRTGLTTVGLAGATVGMPDAAPTIATALRAMGYATGQFGKNHLGDRNEYLPTLHGFDEFWGYLDHLDALEDPFQPNYPQSLKDRVGPRDLLHAWATTTDDSTVDPRWGKVGKQKIEDEGPLPPHPVPGIKYNMETVDDTILDHALQFIDKSNGWQIVFRLAKPDAYARCHASLSEIPKNANGRKWLDDPGSRYGPTRRHRWLSPAKAEGRRPRRQHNRRVHHRQWSGEFHLA
jgi:arylsulfatase A-like enzyme